MPRRRCRCRCGPRQEGGRRKDGNAGTRGHPGGMHCRPPEAEANAHSLAYDTSRGKLPADQIARRGNHLLRRNATLTTEPPEGSLKKRAGEGLPQRLRRSITAPRCSFYVLYIRRSTVKTKTEQTWNLTGSHICRVAQSDAGRCPDIEQKPLIRSVNCCLFHTPVHKTACVYPKAAPSGGTPRCAPVSASPQSHQRSG